jgi:hypothetical protein
VAGILRDRGNSAEIDTLVAANSACLLFFARNFLVRTRRDGNYKNGPGRPPDAAALLVGHDLVSVTLSVLDGSIASSAARAATSVPKRASYLQFSRTLFAERLE